MAFPAGTGLFSLFRGLVATFKTSPNWPQESFGTPERPSVWFWFWFRRIQERTGTNAPRGTESRDRRIVHWATKDVLPRQLHCKATVMPGANNFDVTSRVRFAIPIARKTACQRLPHFIGIGQYSSPTIKPQAQNPGPDPERAARHSPLDGHMHRKKRWHQAEKNGSTASPWLEANRLHKRRTGSSMPSRSRVIFFPPAAVKFSTMGISKEAPAQSLLSKINGGATTPRANGCDRNRRATSVGQDVGVLQLNHPGPLTGPKSGTFSRNGNRTFHQPPAGCCQHLARSQL